MGEFRYVPPPRDGDPRQRASRPETSPRGPVAAPSKREPRQRNVEAVLSLGSTRYLRVHRHAYAVAPVPFKLGQRLLERSIEVTTLARQLAVSGKKEDTVAYYNGLFSLAKMLWPHMRPIGRARRVLKFFGLLRNPLVSASEFEIKDVCDFFLQGRTKSSVQSLSEAEIPARETRTS